MILSLPCHFYLASIGQAANKSLSMEQLLLPFRLPASKEEDETLILGFVTDIIAENFRPNQSIDPFEVAAIAWELGFEPALDFLENGPLQIYQMIKDTRQDGLSP